MLHTKSIITILAIILMLCLFSAVTVYALSHTDDIDHGGYTLPAYINQFDSDTAAVDFVRVENGIEGTLLLQNETAKLDGNAVYIGKLNNGKNATSLTDCLISVSFKGSCRNFGITFRASERKDYNSAGGTVDPYYFYHFGFSGDGSLRLLKRHDNAWVVNATKSGTYNGVTIELQPVSVNVNEWNTLSVLCQKESATFYLNGIKVGSMTDRSALPLDHGSFGLRAYQGGNGVIFDGLSVFTYTDTVLDDTDRQKVEDCNQAILTLKNTLTAETLRDALAQYSALSEKLKPFVTEYRALEAAKEAYLSSHKNDLLQNAPAIDFEISLSESTPTSFTDCNPDIAGGIAWSEKDNCYYYLQCGVNDIITYCIYRGSDLDSMTLVGRYQNALQGYDYSDVAAGSYAWHWFGGGLYIDENGVFYTLVHTEFNYRESHCNNKNHFRSLGYATSTDLGAHWTYGGDIITSDNPTDSSDSFAGQYVDAGAGDPTLFVDEKNGYFYVFYNHVWNKKTLSVTSKPHEVERVLSCRVARSPIDQKMASGSWKNYYIKDGIGTWTENALGGRSSDIISSTVTSYPSLITYVESRKCYLMIAKGPNFQGDLQMVLSTATSLEKQDWSEPVHLGSRNQDWAGAWYMLAVDENTKSQWQVTDRFRVYYHANGFPIYRTLEISDGQTPTMNYAPLYPEEAVPDGNVLYEELAGSHEYDTAELISSHQGYSSEIRLNTATGGSLNGILFSHAQDHLSYTLSHAAKGEYDLYIRMLTGTDCAKISVEVNGTVLCPALDLYNEKTALSLLRVGLVTVGDEELQITLRVINPGNHDSLLLSDSIYLLRHTEDLPPTPPTSDTETDDTESPSPVTTPTVNGNDQPITDTDTPSSPTEAKHGRTTVILCVVCVFLFLTSALFLTLYLIERKKRS